MATRGLPATTLGGNRHTGLTAKIKDYVDRSFHFDWVSIKQIRLIAPGADRIHGRLLQHRRTADDSKVLDPPDLEIVAWSTTVP